MLRKLAMYHNLNWLVGISTALALMAFVTLIHASPISKYISPNGDSIEARHDSYLMVPPTALGQTQVAVDAIEQAITSVDQLYDYMGNLSTQENNPNGEWAEDGKRKNLRDKGKDSKKETLEAKDKSAEGKYEDALKETKEALKKLSELRTDADKFLNEGKLGDVAHQNLHSQTDQIEQQLLLVEANLGKELSADSDDELVVDHANVLPTLNQALTLLVAEDDYTNQLPDDGVPNGEWLDANAHGEIDGVIGKVEDAIKAHLDGKDSDTLKKTLEALKMLVELEEWTQKKASEGKIGQVTVNVMMSYQADIRALLDSVDAMHERTLLFEFGPHGTQFAVPAELVVPWDEVLISDELVWYSGDAGETVDAIELGYWIDEIHETVHYYIDHFSQYYIRRQAPQLGSSDSLQQLKSELRSKWGLTQDMSHQPVSLHLKAPEQTRLLANYPNPFNPETWIPFELGQSSKVEISIFDTSGRLVRQFMLGYCDAGSYTQPSQAIHWDGRNTLGEQVSSGVYLYQLRAGSTSQIRRMLILK